jgi:hypothetical protein
MKIIKIEPKDIFVTLEIGLHDIEKLLKALDHTEINYDHKSDSKEDIQIGEAANYLINEFYPILKEVVEDLVNDS